MRSPSEHPQFWNEEIVIVGSSSGNPRMGRLRPSDFRPLERTARILMVALIEVVDSEGLAMRTAESYLTAVKSYLAYLAAQSNAEKLSLTTNDEHLTLAHDAWEGAMLARSGHKSGIPNRNSAHICKLLQFINEEYFKLGDLTQRRALAGPAVLKPSFKPLAEYSNAERLAFRDVARVSIRDMEKRLEAGRKMLNLGECPVEHGWDDSNNLLWALQQGELTRADIRTKVDVSSLQWPEAVMSGSAYHETFPFHSAMRRLLTLLGPVQQDLMAFEIIMLLETGWAPEELRNLRMSEWKEAAGARTYLKHKPRAHKAQHETFPSGGEWGFNGLIDRWVKATSHIRLLAASSQADYAFLVAVPMNEDPGWRIGRRPLSTYSLSIWIEEHGLTISQPHELRRLRKTTKLIRSIQAGTLAGAAGDDHTVEVFRNHYLPTTTINTLAPIALNAALEWVMQKSKESAATGGPTVVLEPASSAAQSTDYPEDVVAAGKAEVLAAPTDKKMLPVQCKSITDSPWAGPGTLCPARIRQCFSCPNAVVFQDHLPRVLTFLDRLEALKAELPPPQFMRTYGQVYSNLLEILENFPGSAISEARTKKTSDGLFFPLEMRLTHD